MQTIGQETKAASTVVGIATVPVITVIIQFSYLFFCMSARAQRTGESVILVGVLSGHN